MGKERLIPIFALVVLIIGSASSLYVYATTANSDFIIIDGTEYTIDQLFFLGEDRSINEYTGSALDVIIEKTGVATHESQTYTLIAADGYEKTVQWENMQNGILTRDGQSVFSDLPKAFWVKDIVEIKVS